MKKKILSLGMCTALVAVSVVGGVFAYLSEEASATNVMKVGNVEIEQLEYERVQDENGNPVEGVEGTDFDADYGITRSYKLQPFTQNKAAFPAVYQEGKEIWDDFQQLWNGVDAPGSNDLFDDSMKNVIDKFVFVKNTGNSDAYFRTIIAIECPEGEEGLIHTNFNTNSRYDYDATENGNQEPSDDSVIFVTVDGVRYAMYTATHTEALGAGEVARPSLLQVFLDPEADNEDCAKFGDEWKILAVSQAVQTAGFEDAQQALEAEFGVVDAANAVEIIKAQLN